MSKCCIYHIEDNPTDRKMFAFVLEQHSIKIDLHTAEDGEIASQILEAVAAGNRCRPSIVVLDLNLPKFSGLEILRKIRNTRAIEDLPVVVLTSSDAPQDRQQTESLGIEAYMKKPMDLQDLTSLVQSILLLASKSSKDCLPQNNLAMLN